MDANRLDREMKNLTRPKLLVLDEVGYLQFDPIQASLLFQVICQRWSATRSAFGGSKADKMIEVLKVGFAPLAPHYLLACTADQAWHASSAVCRSTNRMRSS